MEVTLIFYFFESVGMILTFLGKRSPEYEQSKNMIKDCGVCKLRITHIELIQILPIFDFYTLLHIFSNNQATLFFCRINA